MTRHKPDDPLPRPVCGAKTREGPPCQKSPLAGRNRCKYHGGASLRGAESPKFRHGRYSKILPRNLSREYLRLMADPDLLSAKEEVALLNARLQQLVARLGTGESTGRWDSLKREWAEFKRAQGAGDREALTAVLPRLDSLVTAGGDEGGQWEEITAYVERVSVVAARESKRQAAEGSVISLEQMVLVIRTIADAVITNVRDEAARLAIIGHIRSLRLLPDGHGGGGLGPLAIRGDDKPEPGEAGRPGP
jgi:hypothetical protein